jgi:hypothetical protein
MGAAPHLGKPLVANSRAVQLAIALAWIAGYVCGAAGLLHREGLSAWAITFTIMTITMTSGLLAVYFGPKSWRHRALFIYWPIDRALLNLAILYVGSAMFFLREGPGEIKMPVLLAGVAFSMLWTRHRFGRAEAAAGDPDSRVVAHVRQLP